MHATRSFSIAMLAAGAAAQSNWTQGTSGPSARMGYMLAFDQQTNCAVLFGGQNSMYLIGGDMWRWGGALGVPFAFWSPLMPAHLPSPRYSGGFGYDPGRARVVLFGGKEHLSLVQDTWEYDGVDWTQGSPSNLPSARMMTALAYDSVNSCMLMFGGLGLGTLGDTWSWNGTDWTQLSPAHSPAARGEFGMVSARATVVLHGGRTITSGGFVVLQDTWLWNGVDWQTVTTTVSPPAVYSFGMTYDPARDVVVRFGGFSPTNSAETWLLTGSTWIRDPSIGPSARGNMSLVYDQARGNVLLYGGYLNASTSSIAYSDTWTYSVPIVATSRLLGSGCGGSVGVPSLGPVGGARPLPGTVFPLQAASAPANALTLFGVGLSSTTWSGGALPVSLAPVGMPGCTWFCSADAVVGQLTDPQGRATLNIVVPPLAALVGTSFFAQALVLDPPANALGATASDAVACVVGSL